VMNPKGGTSGPVNLIVGANITSLSPANTMVGSPAFTLTVNGSAFVSGATVTFNGANRSTTFVNSNQLTAQILASDVAVAVNAPVTVVNPGVPASAPANFPVNNPSPTLDSVAPSN